MDITLDERGTDGPLALVLHGGGGPATVAPFVAHLAETHHVIAPTHPGWNGTDRPDDLDTVRALAGVYLDLLEQRDARNAVLVGNSLGGWIALEMAVQAAERGSDAVGALVVVDAVGVTVPDEPVRDFFALDARGVAEYAWHDPERGYLDPATLSDERRRVQAANMVALRTYAGAAAMADPTLASRLADVRVPALVLWGDSDRIVTPAYGAALADALPDARFVVVEAAGHLPQLERADATFAAVDAFVTALPTPGADEAHDMR
ncbi:MULTISPECIES: alpha/beta fold hydrolase [unclassified Curtobacterium]|uniref:alpha/beta fold hydrolase n=1 Tax=unclassified Curtobacterium TaxID=257496 RepID=UPI000DA98E70|nr:MULTISPECIES: alpha/beta hydrolase [unclassified Curtobacterium]PZE25405.1 alpha/beta hydrolase [Curtobacterium sp. MCBD17_028]PZE75431.1 alpha/beta hydrolase [Curtobacterium sp. MCBD17_019]PZF55460.1 alpha/beta hydrolase [Curtobacterium sp. MCBD17_034]PZM33241.1 alpha/beta hydrolase [Curtobacterium sp. MCBD17_031]